mmetsp:Transcript_11933/g.35855  ORF Transcript_11933/g.35855 Transcript_11933/m.35855 type:complete len:601 (+) Transcript_11933:99-1901(+)
MEEERREPVPSTLEFEVLLALGAVGGGIVGLALARGVVVVVVVVVSPLARVVVLRKDVALVGGEEGAGLGGAADLGLVDDLVEDALGGLHAGGGLGGVVAGALAEVDGALGGLEAVEGRLGAPQRGVFVVVGFPGGGAVGGSAFAAARGRRGRRLLRRLERFFVVLAFVGVVVDGHFAPGSAVGDVGVLALERRPGAEDVAVERDAVLVDGRLAPAAGVVAEGGAVRDGGVEAGDAEVRVRRRRSVALHVDQPRRRRPVGHSQRCFERRGQRPRLLLEHVHLVLLAFVIQSAGARQSGLRLPLEERVVQHLVVHVHPPRPPRHAVPRLLLDLLQRLRLLDRLPDLLDAGLGDELRQHERLLLDAALALQIAPLVAPVPRHRDGVPVALQVNEQTRVAGSDVVGFDRLRSRHDLLQLRHRHPAQQLPLPPAQRRSLLLLLAVRVGFVDCDDARSESTVASVVVVVVSRRVVGGVLQVFVGPPRGQELGAREAGEDVLELLEHLARRRVRVVVAHADVLDVCNRRRLRRRRILRSLVALLLLALLLLRLLPRVPARLHRRLHHRRRSAFNWTAPASSATHKPNDRGRESHRWSNQEGLRIRG